MKKERYTPKNCIAKTKQDCFYFSCIFNHHNGGDCTREEQLPDDGIELRHRVKVEKEGLVYRGGNVIYREGEKWVK